MTDYNIGCGPYSAPKPWVNLDVFENDTIKPDVVVHRVIDPLDSFDDVEKVYAGHVLEHVIWEIVPEFLVNLHRKMKPGNQLLVVGPDVEKAVKLWHYDQLDWATMLATMEGYNYVDPATQESTVPLWEGARHTWNCTEDRVVYALSQLFTDVKPMPIQSNFLDDWPITSRAAWQCAVIATR